LSDINRRDFIKDAGVLAVGATLAAKLSGVAIAQPRASGFDINSAFAEFMRGIGGSPADAGGKVVFTGRDPIVRSHFRIATCMAIPAMGAGVSAAATWRERTQQTQDLTVDLREALYNVNPVITLVMQQRIATGQIPADDAVARNFSFVPTINGRWYQAPRFLWSLLSPKITGT
jgi:hypothetical protein